MECLTNMYGGFKEGNKVIITGRFLWASDLNQNIPPNNLSEENPYYCTIEKIKFIESGKISYYAMTCGKYGWVIDDLVRLDTIKRVECPDKIIYKEYKDSI